MTALYAATARAFRAAIRKHEFSEPQWRIVDVILFYSLERPLPRLRALVPRQAVFGLLCGRLSKGKISEELGWLELQQVIERENIEVIVAGQRRTWTAYALQPPGGWRVPWRVRESTLLQNLEDWLEVLDIEQVELLAPPISLNELLREDFVERTGSLAGHSPFNERRVEGPRPGSPGGNFGAQIESKERQCDERNRAPMVSRAETHVEPQLAATVRAPEVPPGGTYPTRVPPGGTASVPPGGTPRVSSSSTRGTRVEKDSTFTRLEYLDSSTPVPPGGTAWLADGYVRDKLATFPKLSQELVNGKSFDGRSSLLGRQFGELWKRDPDEARELLGVAITKNKPNAWLNTAVRVALGVQKIPTRPAAVEWRPGQ